MSKKPTFEAAFPYQQDVLALPVTDLDVASDWYSRSFGMSEVERTTETPPAVILERDRVRIGFSLTGQDPAMNGAAILVSNIASLRQELQTNGVQVANWRIDERDGERFHVFFVVAPDGLCYYFHEQI